MPEEIKVNSSSVCGLCGEAVNDDRYTAGGYCEECAAALSAIEVELYNATWFNRKEEADRTMLAKRIIKGILSSLNALEAERTEKDKEESEIEIRKSPVVPVDTI